MNLIVYKKNNAADETSLQIYLKSLLSEEKIEIFDSIEAIRERISMTFYSEAIVVLIIENRNELSEFLPVIELFRKLRIVLILPDRQPETIKIGYRLEPRFLSFIDKGYSEVKAVLRKMLESMRVIGETF